MLFFFSSAARSLYATLCCSSNAFHAFAIFCEQTCHDNPAYSSCFISSMVNKAYAFLALGTKPLLMALSRVEGSSFLLPFLRPLFFLCWSGNFGGIVSFVFCRILLRTAVVTPTHAFPEDGWDLLRSMLMFRAWTTITSDRVAVVVLPGEPEWCGNRTSGNRGALGRLQPGRCPGAPPGKVPMACYKELWCQYV